MSASKEAVLEWVPPFQVGESFSREVVFDAESIRTFARMALDDNPLHHDEDYAKTTRFGGLIASGTQTIGVTTGSVAAFLTGRCSALGLQFNCTLRRAVRAGEAATIFWRIDKITPKASLGGYLLEMTGRLVTSAGQDAVAVKATTLILPPSGLSGPQS
ncbi:MaoC family dehydratase [Rhodoligotrophos defluvii]|uniref:MaoC family dehydratase n=1 Tax=Rhodoligotrophos defluvii TaxID=2561934 RepID=UPI0010C9B34E|nr:MaoC family dehydratase [Rhodoligotrophos defluvii]